PTLRRIADALASTAELDAVIGLGGLVEPEELDLPDHVVGLRWAPQSELLAEADVAVLHGGITSIGEALLAGTPMVLLSTHTNDQDGTVARAGRVGVAVALDHRTVTTDALAGAVRHALTDDTLRARVVEVSAAVAAESRSGAVVGVLEELATP
ncbi:MAG: nucleotide disphospho-sugar-binding domain-containing protein, partial [Actinomycetota bacterium]